MARRSLSFFYIIFLLLFFAAANVFAASSLTVDEVDRDRIEAPGIKAFSDVLSHYMMGLIYDNAGNTTRAMDEYRAALVYGDRVSEIHLKLGADFVFTGDLKAARAELERAVELDPSNIKAYLLSGIIFTAEGDFDSARAEYEKALDNDPDNIKALTFLSDLFVIQQKLEQAAEVYEKILRVKENDAFIYYNLGIIYSKLDQMEKAEDNLMKAVEVDNEYIEAMMVLGFIFEVEGKFTDALDQYRKVIKFDALNREAYVRLGQLYYRLGQTEKALEQNRILMRLDVSSPEPYLRNFSIYAAEKNYRKAEAVLREALRKGIADAVIYASLGYLAGLEGDQRKAVNYYTVAGEKDPSNYMYPYYRAVALDKGGRSHEAKRVLEKALEEGADIPQIYNLLGYLLVEQDKDLDRAISLIEKALDKDPDNGAYLDSLGWAYFRKGMLAEAERYLREAVKHLPSDPVVRDHLGDVYMAGGKHEKAAAQWIMSLKADPSDKTVLKKLQKLKEILRREK